MISIRDIKKNIKGGYISLYNNQIYSIENHNKEKNKNLYMISFSDSDKTTYTKIGIAKNVDSRLSQLQQKIEYEISLYYKRYIPNTYIIEQAIQSSLNKCNVKSYTFGKVNKSKIELPNYTEWFSIDHKTKEKIKTFADNINVICDEVVEQDAKRKEISYNYKESKYSYILDRGSKRFYKLNYSQSKVIHNLKSKTNIHQELDFLNNMMRKFSSNKYITESQVSYLKYIYNKYTL